MAGLTAGIIAAVAAAAASAGGSVLAQKSANKQRDKEATRFQLDKVENKAFGDDMVLDKSFSDNANLSLTPRGNQLPLPGLQKKQPFLDWKK